MKKVILVLVALVAVFIVVWIIKLQQPLKPADPYEDGLSGETPWWESAPGEAPEPDEDWILDYDIPENYIPVLGRDELYMEVDENGNIIRYRQRTQMEDGTWVWETVDPNIPENYEPVEGLENVYKVTEADGSVHYYKYTRNDDDTYFFTEVDENGDPLDDGALTDDEIPANYVRIEGTNVYAVYNEYGVLVGYKERVQNEDGTYSWVDCEAPTEDDGNAIEEGTGAVPGSQGDNQTSNNNSSGSQGGGGGDINIVGSDVEDVRKGYTEEKVYTDTKHIDGWTIVYETIVTKTYDENGDLLSTKTDGPNEINRFPDTEWNSEVFDELQGGADQS